MSEPRYLTRHQTPAGPRWAINGHFGSFSLAQALGGDGAALEAAIQAAQVGETASGALLAPIDAEQEVWASGVTYLRSRDARQAESSVGDVYARVYEAERPELFFKALGWRAVSPEGTVRIRHDSTWDVPEPEIVLVINRAGEIVGYCAGNDMSSRSIEGENPLYLPQAKVYTDSCALGPGILLADAAALAELPVELRIWRDNAEVFHGTTSATQMKRRFDELARYLVAALDFPTGVFLMTGTGIVPPETFTLQAGDQVEVRVGELRLRNTVQTTAANH